MEVCIRTSNLKRQKMKTASTMMFLAKAAAEPVSIKYLSKEMTIMRMKSI